MEWKVYSYEDQLVPSLGVDSGELSGVPLEVPLPLRENDFVRLAKDIIPVEMYGYGADIISAGFCRIFSALDPNRVQYSGISERYQSCLDLVGASDFARALLEVRTTGQVRLLESLVDRAVSLVPGVLNSERCKGKEWEDLFAEVWNSVYNPNG